MTSRVKFEKVEFADVLLTKEYLEFLVATHDLFSPSVEQIRKKRQAQLQKALKEGKLPTFLEKSKINVTDWKVPELPKSLLEPGIEISGPSSQISMMINALNPGPEGERATGYLDDDEDSGGHSLWDTLSSAKNRLDAIEGRLGYFDKAKNKHYKVQPGDLPFFVHRERGWMLDEHGLKIDGKPVSATLLGETLTFFHCGRAQVNKGLPIYCYLPKMELVEEAELHRDVYLFATKYLKYPANAQIKAIPLIESLPAVYIMDELLFALGPFAGGLNAARWDLKASILEYVMNDPKQVWPDRFGVDVKKTPMLTNIFRRLVSVCLRHGAAPIGGMATALPHKDEEVNKAASQSIAADKEWEASNGFIRGWVAHIFHMKVAADPFKRLRGPNWKPTPEMLNSNNYPVEIVPPPGEITVEGTRRNCRMLIEYVEGWLNGRGAKGIDSLEGRPGIHPALMEDLATGRISAAQTAQRIRHKVKSKEGQVHDAALVRKILADELADILSIRKKEIKDAAEFEKVEKRYRQAFKVSQRWIANYVNLDFRSLGSYTHAQLEKIASEPDALGNAKL